MRSNKYEALLFWLNQGDLPKEIRHAHQRVSNCVGLILKAKHEATKLERVTDEFLNEVFFQLVIHSASEVQEKGIWLPQFRQLLALLADPEVGPWRFFRCENCGTFRIGRKGQRFCTYQSGSTACRVQWHYKQDPEKKKAQVKRWRKENPGMG